MQWSGDDSRTAEAGLGLMFEIGEREDRQRVASSLRYALRFFDDTH